MGIVNAGTNTAISRAINESIASVMISNSTSCDQTNNNLQSINISNIKTARGCSLKITGVTQTTASISNFSCIAKNSTDTKIKSDIESKLKAEVAKVQKGFPNTLFDFSSNTTITENVQRIMTSMNLKNTFECVQNTTNTQTLNLDNLYSSCPRCCNTAAGCVAGNADCKMEITNLNQQITSNAIGTCLASNTNITDAITNIASTLDASVKTEQELTLAGMLGFGSSTTTSILFIIGCILCIVFSSSSFSVAAIAMKSGSGGSGGSGQPVNFNFRRR